MSACSLALVTITHGAEGQWVSFLQLILIHLSLRMFLGLEVGKPAQGLKQ